jgi:hypothetical protein
MRTPHIIRCPECHIELCADPACTVHPPDTRVSLHVHRVALKALLLVHACRGSS